MLIALASDSLLLAATRLTVDAAFEVGFSGDSAITNDPLDAFRWSLGTTVTVGVNDRDDATGWSATLAPGFYATPAHFAAELARARATADGVTWTGSWLQGSTNRYRFRLMRASGTKDALVSSGAHASTNALRLLAGFRREDRAAAATLTGDYACLGGPYQEIVYDLGSVKYANACAVVGPRGSSAATWTLAGGTTAACADYEVTLGDASDDELMAARVTFGYRYAAFRCYDARRTDAAECGAGLLFLGQGVDTDEAGAFDRVDWQADGYAHALDARSRLVPSVAGPGHIMELAPGATFGVSFAGSPGVAASLLPPLQRAAAAMGRNAYALVMLDVAEPNRESAWCRVPSPATAARALGSDRNGRWSLPATTFEKAFIR